MTDPELWLGAIEGVRRRLAHLTADDPGRYGVSREDAWRVSVVGAIAEVAGAKAIGGYWHPLGEHGVDVGARVQVRWRPSHDWDLLLHPPRDAQGRRGDAPDHLYLHVTGEPPTFRIHGWIRGDEGQRAEYWGDPYGTGRPAYWVPRAALLDLWLLPRDA